MGNDVDICESISVFVSHGLSGNNVVEIWLFLRLGSNQIRPPTIFRLALQLSRYIFFSKEANFQIEVFLKRYARASLF